MAFDLASVLSNVSDSDTAREQIEYIKLDLLEEDPNNFYQLTGVEELAANIQLCGLQQPIRVRPIPGESERYRIVSGHRRRAALVLLAKENPERWSEAACIVEDDEVSPALQQLRLIYANANTRTMTNAELSEQAVQVEKLLYQLKEEGYEFPGRMRDHVAQAVNASKTKLARLKVIRENLAACWQPAWKDGTLTENTAYELSKIPKAYQSVLFEEKSRSGANLAYLYADDVRKFAERASAIVKQACKDSDGECSNYENKIRKAAVAGRYGWFYCDKTCCRDCQELLRCQRACPKLKATIQKMKADAKAAVKQEAAAQAERDRPVIEKISELWQRFGLAREMAFKEFDDCKKAMGIYSLPYDAAKMMQLECGEAAVTTQTDLPYGYTCHLPEIKKYIAIADLLDCSIDYLFCRTDVREMAQEGSMVSDSDTDTASDEKGTAQTAPPVAGWQSGTPEESGTYAAYVRIEGVSQSMLRELYWNGEWWSLHNERIPDDVQVACWVAKPDPIHKTPEKTESAGNGSCITGCSPTGHCGAAAYCSEDYTCCFQCPEDCSIRCGFLDAEDAK